MFDHSRRCSALIFIVCCLFWAGSSRADDVKRVEIPAGDLIEALQSLAKQTGIELVYQTEAIKGIKTKGVSGTLTPANAVTKLLQGTGLRLNTDSSGAMLIAAPPSLSHGSSNRLVPAADDAGSATRLAQTHSATTSTGGPQNQDDPRRESKTSSPSEEDPRLAEIIVTGTNISGVENKTVPILSFDRDAIDRSGYATLADFITALPQNVKTSGNSPDGALTGASDRFNNRENSTAANLRGLGSSSTLTLLNGHRVAAASTGTGVDLSMIPLSAVERIDVLTDGSSAVYGSDAVGGVINIILRKDFNGQETSARLDTLSRGGGELKQAAQTVGRDWSTGGALAVFQFQDSNVLRADQRTFTAVLPEPTIVLPSAKRYSGVLSAHQSLGSTLEIFADALLENNKGETAETNPIGNQQITDSKTNSTSANAGFKWQAFGDWHLEGNGVFSQVDTSTTMVFKPAQPGYVNGEPNFRGLETIKEGDLKLDGTLFSAGASSIKAAIGASYRQETFSGLTVYTDSELVNTRHVHAAYAEFYAPLVTAANALPWIRKLDLSAAVRDDSYSDFGSKTNPRFGVYFAPLDQIALRVAYSTSFRAPDPTELFNATSANRIIIESGIPQPGDPTGKAPVLFYGNQVLHPETSRNLTAGLDFIPLSLPNTRFSLNYYRIIFNDRITLPPLNGTVFVNQAIYGPLITQFPNDAAVQALVASIQPPQQIFDLSAGQTGLAGIRYAYKYGDINATHQKTEGLDWLAHSTIALQASAKLNLDFNATYIREIETTFCTTCTTTDLANTYGEPLKLRLRAGGGWSNGTFSTNAAVNYANAYTDNNIVPFGRIAAFTTLDLNAAWLIKATGTTLSMNILNALNSNPPFTAPAFFGVHYDPTNADPRGRTLSLQVKQAW
jgi:iron complex outermembrane recepter protein